jgi:4-hydroxybenzoate polyprenyltransferase
MDSLALIVQSLRPKQWTKNLLVFAGIIFSNNLFDFTKLAVVLAAFVIFCALSGVIYIFNDLLDLENDKNHPVKSKRPLASGKLNTTQAKFALAALIPASFAGSIALGSPFLIVVFSYFSLQIAYSLYLKKVVIIDVFAIAFGFLLRALAGAVVIGVSISSWLIICTILLSLFLGMSKRRHELLLLEDSSLAHRFVLTEYSPYLLDQMISIVTASTVIAYTLYTTAPETMEKFGTRNLVFTVPFVLYGIFRYLYLVHKKGGGGSPEQMLLSDIPLLINILLWAISVIVIISRG